MARGDQTGPIGLGPRTGRGLGFCNGYNVPGFMNPGFKRGMGRGRGFGWRRVLPVYPEQVPVQQELTKEQEKQLLQQELKEIEQEKQEILKRLKTLK